jgi:hypothetical protein
VTDLTMPRGDSRTIELTQPLEGDGLTPTDFTTYQNVWFTVKKMVTDADGAAVMQKTLGNGIAVVSSDHTRLRITINPADTANLTITGQSLVLLYDVQTKDSGGNINTPASGSIILTPDITLTR